MKVIDLILTKEWSIYLKDYGKAESKYNRIQASTAFNLVEKLKEGAKKGKSFLFRFDVGGKTSEKDDIKMLEFISKQLRTIINQSATF
jgi:hypothetical protein